MGSVRMTHGERTRMSRAHSFLAEWILELTVATVGVALFLAMPRCIHETLLGGEEDMLFEWSAQGVIDDYWVSEKGDVTLRVSGSSRVVVSNGVIRLGPDVLKPGRMFSKGAYTRVCFVDGVKHYLY